jgi:uncharacterized membrane protein YqaE (UPF0057 family)
LARKVAARESPGIRVLERTNFMDIARVIFSVIIPPVGVFLKRGLSWSFVLSILLTILGYFPGLIYALYVVLGDDR